MLTIEMSTKTVEGYFDAQGNPTASTGALPTPVERTVAKVMFNTLPTNVDELREYEGYLKDKAAGRFVIYGLLAATFKAYDATLPREGNARMYAMMEYLHNSPYVVKSAKTPFGTFDRQFIDDRMRQGNKFEYQGDVYWDGATYKNGYVPTEPRTITVEDYVYYCPQAATASTPEYYTMACYGSDYADDGSGSFSSPQLLTATYSNADGRWYLCPLGYSWNKLLSDASVKAPDQSASW